MTWKQARHPAVRSHGRNGEIVEEKLFYDQVSFLRQIGVL